jgi:hypothetical protein
MTFSLILDNEPQVTRTHCCEAMTHQASLSSPFAESPLLGTTDKRVYWSPLLNEYGLICQPSPEILQIAFCPFCGSELPPSRRDEWFRKLEATGWKTWGDPVPDFMFTENWHSV